MIKIGVIGTGTVGILAISHLLGYLNNDFKVVSIHDPNTKILGVGESSQPRIYYRALAYRALEGMGRKFRL
jgi:predicted dehydrogenase